jgi:3-oxoacyl-[acyl-carrier protein] reductase
MKYALITGATGGIGGSIAKSLKEAGYGIIISGTSQEKLDKLALELGGVEAAIPCNLADTNSIKELAKKADELSGGVDVLVNNAGITKDNISLRMTEEDFMSVLNINLVSSFTLIKSLCRGMMKKKGGRIINISSVVAHLGNAGQANYVASKAGLEGMSRTFALEFASRNITVNCIAPGFIDTAMTHVLSEDVKNQMMARIPLGTFGTAEDVASGVAFLASDGAKYITGQVLHINGGMYL